MSARTVEAEHLSVVAVEARHDDKRVATDPPSDHPVEVQERLVHVAPVDRIGEVPRGDPTGAAEERLDFCRPNPRPLAVRGNEILDDPGESPHILAEVIQEQVARRGVDLERCIAQLQGEPCSAVSRLVAGPRGLDHTRLPGGVEEPFGGRRFLHPLDDQDGRL